MIAHAKLTAKTKTPGIAGGLLAGSWRLEAGSYLGSSKRLSSSSTFTVMDL